MYKNQLLEYDLQFPGIDDSVQWTMVSNIPIWGEREKHNMY